MDGPSLSGDKYSGPIGKLLPHAETLPINPQFTVIETFLVPAISEEALKRLNGDQKVFVQLVLIITTGRVPQNFEKYKIGEERLKNIDFIGIFYFKFSFDNVHFLKTLNFISIHFIPQILFFNSSADVRSSLGDYKFQTFTCCNF